MAVRISFWTVIKAPVLRKRNTQNDKHSFMAGLTASWLPKDFSGRAQVCSHPQRDRFCDPDAATFGVHKFIRLPRCMSADTGLTDSTLANASHVVHSANS